MKKIILLGIVALTVGCGRSSSDNEMTGQVKRVMRNTPILCPKYFDADISMGVFRNGVGSASKEDVWVYTPSLEDYNKLKVASARGTLVKITYDEYRTVFCVENLWVTSVEEIK